MNFPKLHFFQGFGSSLVFKVNYTKHPANGSDPENMRSL